MYENIIPGNKVIYKEGNHIDWCVVEDINIKKNMKVFHLVSLISGLHFNVSVRNDGEGAAYCPWRFIPSNEATDFKE